MEGSSPQYTPHWYVGDFFLDIEAKLVAAVREILSTLMAQILECLSSQSSEQREVCYPTLMLQTGPYLLPDCRENNRRAMP